MTDTDREPLSRQRIARTGLAMIGDIGLPGLSMRKLGSELGVEAMSLYHYVSNKDDLLDAILDQLYDKIELPQDTADNDWETAIRAALVSFNTVLQDHPQSLELFVSRPGRSLSAFRVLRWCLDRFRAAGLTDVMEAGRAFHFCVSFVIGHAVTEAGSMSQVRKGILVDTSVVDDEDFAQFVNLSQDLSSDEVFNSAVDTVIAGLRASFDLG